jgi:hypothetical protein
MFHSTVGEGMRLVVILAWLAVGLGISCATGIAQTPADPVELTSALSVFSAHATAGNGIRLNWTLDHQSPIITKFRLYRGYEEVGAFSVLTEITTQHTMDTVAYSFKDTTARAGVSYYYKLAAMSQNGESIFPVVITAVPLSPDQDPMKELPAAAILPDAKILLYVRSPGRVHLSIVSSPPRILVDETLRPGLYEFNPPSGDNPFSLRLEHEQGLRAEISWPLR